MLLFCFGRRGTKTEAWLVSFGLGVVVSWRVNLLNTGSPQLFHVEQSL